MPPRPRRFEIAAQLDAEELAQVVAAFAQLGLGERIAVVGGAVEPRIAAPPAAPVPAAPVPLFVPPAPVLVHVPPIHGAGGVPPAVPAAGPLLEFGPPAGYQGVWDPEGCQVVAPSTRRQCLRRPRAGRRCCTIVTHSAAEDRR